MNALVELRAESLEPSAFSDLFDRLIWMEQDNGGAIIQVLIEWLSGDDGYKMSVALGIQEVFLFNTRTDMEGAYKALERKHGPSVAARCQEVLMHWDRTAGRQGI